MRNQLKVRLCIYRVCSFAMAFNYNILNYLRFNYLKLNYLRINYLRLTYAQFLMSLFDRNFIILSIYSYLATYMRVCATFGTTSQCIMLS